MPSPRSTWDAGIVVVKVSSNSAKTWNGRANVPSELGAPLALVVAVGRVPRPVIAERALAELPASSRYFVTNFGHSRVSGSTRRFSPNSTGTEHGPISKSARPAKSGPQTLILAPMEIEKESDPKGHGRSMSMPAEMRA